MKKKIVLMIGAVTLALGLVGCGGSKNNTELSKETTKKESQQKDDEKYVAFVTDVGSIDDKGFNEGSWNGVKGFADENGYKSDFFRPAADTEEARGETIDKAVDAGADVLVCVGYLFETVVNKKQAEYKDIEILFIDGEPKDDKGNVEIATNTHSILFKEEESGYLAGYAAVKEGFTKLGYLGGMDIPSVARFGYGFVQGADVAAKELGKKGIEINYKYVGGFQPSDEITNGVKRWYDSGTEVVFSCGGGIVYSVIEATEYKENRKIIGVDVDQSGESKNIVFSAMKGLTASIKTALEVYEKNNMTWPEDRAGKMIKVGVKEDGVGLSATKDSWRLNNMTLDEYENMIKTMKSKDLNIINTEIPQVENVKVNLEK